MTNMSEFDVGPTLHKCYRNVLCLLGGDYWSDVQWDCLFPAASPLLFIASYSMLYNSTQPPHIINSSFLDLTSRFPFWLVPLKNESAQQG